MNKTTESFNTRNVLGEPATNRFTSDVAEQLRSEIQRCGGREVFFACSTEEDGKISAARVVARGHEGAVPAILEAIKLREVVVHNHPSGNIAPSDADLQVAALFGHNGNGVYITDNDVSRVYVVVEPQFFRKCEALNLEELSRSIAPNSRISQEIPDFEVRPQQKRMMEFIVEAFNADRISIIEAPTGVGKTIAYLLPAVDWSLKNRERVVISTRTINLQEQLMHKDIPLVAKCFEKPFLAVLVKGRGNYLCRRRFARVLSETALFEDERKRDILRAIADWAEHTSDGSLSDLSFVPPRDLWTEICSEADSCRPSICPNVQRCFLFQARKTIAKADVLVVNHHMLFSDLALKRELGRFDSLAVLPPYQRVILDEAHSIEDSATEFFGNEVSLLGVLSSLGRLYRLERQAERGLIHFLKMKIMGLPLKGKEFIWEGVVQSIDQRLIPSIELARTQVEALFEHIRDFVSESTTQIGHEVKFRLTPPILSNAAISEIKDVHLVPVAQDLQDIATRIKYLLDHLLNASKNTESEEDSTFREDCIELQTLGARLEQYALFMGTFLHPEPRENTVKWIEIDTKNPRLVRLIECPLEIGPLLAECFQATIKTAVMTSATLSVGGSFKFFSKRVGLNLMSESHVGFESLDSPFNFMTQAIMCVPSDLPDPNEPAFFDESTEVIRDILNVTGGHALILFTSFYALDYAYSRLQPFLRENGILALRQGNASRTYLLNQFRKEVSSVLFATDSFWEGIDVAGEALQCVIVPRLPFRVPTEPLFEARAEAIDLAGGNSFLEYTVPQAVIKLRQGFGRLIRRKTDRGSIVVLDKRLVQKPYGRVFLQSLPAINLRVGKRVEIMQNLRDFHRREREDP